MSQKFEAGQRVLVNGGLVATIITYDEQANVVVVEHPVGGSRNTITLHISNTTLEPLGETAPADGSVLYAEPEVAEPTDDADESADIITTSEGPKRRGQK